MEVRSLLRLPIVFRYMSDSDTDEIYDVARPVEYTDRPKSITEMSVTLDRVTLTYSDLLSVTERHAQPDLLHFGERTVEQIER